jgi:hypothetical protein
MRLSSGRRTSYLMPPSLYEAGARRPIFLVEIAAFIVPARAERISDLSLPERRRSAGARLAIHDSQYASQTSELG